MALLPSWIDGSGVGNRHVGRLTDAAFICKGRKHKAKAALCDICNRDCPAKASKCLCKVILVQHCVPCTLSRPSFEQKAVNSHGCFAVDVSDLETIGDV